MPKRTDISKILIIGSGPIVIGQSAEFDYSGAQACKALKSEGYEVVLANSNPATIMTDPEFAERTYIEPLTRDFLEEILRIEAAVAEEFEGVAVHHIGARLGHGIHRGAGADATGGFLGTGNETEFLERIRERQVQARTVEVVQVRGAVEGVRHAEVIATGQPVRAAPPRVQAGNLRTRMTSNGCLGPMQGVCRETAGAFPHPMEGPNNEKQSDQQCA